MLENCFFECLVGLVNSDSLSDQNLILTLTTLKQITHNCHYLNERCSKILHIKTLYKFLEKKLDNIILHFLVIISKIGKNFMLNFRYKKKRVWNKRS